MTNGTVVLLMVSLTLALSFSLRGIPLDKSDF
jgi:hypothetical protein